MAHKKGMGSTRNGRDSRRSELSEASVRTLLRATTYRDPMWAQRRRMGITTEGLTPRIRSSEEVGDQLVFWRGSLGKIIRLLKAAEVSYQLHDNRLWLTRVAMPHTIELRLAWAKKGPVGIRGDKIPSYREGLRGRRNKPPVTDLNDETVPVTSTQGWLDRPDDLGTLEI